MIDALAQTSTENLTKLVQRALDVLEKSENRQVYIGVAGGPGSGKSTLTTDVSAALNKRVGAPISSVIPMDGYHIPKRMLQELADQGKIIGDPAEAERTGHVPTYEELMSRRGAPWTFDPKSLYADLKKAKELGYGTFPTYCRLISDPLMDGVVLDEKQRIIFCEGNYLLAFEDKDWAPLEEIWDDKWYIYVPEPVVRERLIQRHLRTWNEEKIKRFGEGREGAAKKVDFSDIINSRWIESHSKQYADLVVDNS